MTGYVADLIWKSGARAIEKLDRLRSTMAVNVLRNGVSNSQINIQAYSNICFINFYLFQQLWIYISVYKSLKTKSIYRSTLNVKGSLR